MTRPWCDARCIIACHDNPARRYRKKPVVIQAAQWDGSAQGAAALVTWLPPTAEYHPHLMDGVLIAHPDPFIRIPTLEGVMISSAGDWIIKGVKGEFYPCKPDIFESTYELVDDAG